MRRIGLAVLVLAVLACGAGAQQINSLDALRQSFRQQEKALLDGYGKALDALAADLRKKGELEAYLLAEKEVKRFQEEGTASALDKATNVVRVAAAAYYKARLDMLRKAVAAWDAVMRSETKAGRIEAAKEAKEEKDKVAAELASLGVGLSKRPEKSKELVKAQYPSLAGTWVESRPNFPAGGAEYVFTQSEGGKLKVTGSFPAEWKATFVGEGTLSESGKMTLRIKLVKRPKGWEDGVMEGQLSEDGAKVTGRNTWDKGGFDLVLTKKE